MKAFLADRYGGPEVMRLGALPEPQAGKGQVVVEVVASSVNPVDYKLRSGELRLLSGRRFPRAFGTDFSGVIHALGPGVTGWEVGDAVYGLSVTMFGANGAHAERVAVAATELRRKPEGLSFEEAATVPVAALTALHGLRLCGDLAGKALLINGATGGVGHFAVQIARARGATVTAVCSAANAGHASDWGAAEVVDYRVRDVTRERLSFDAIYDAHGHLGFTAAREVLAPRGSYVTPLGLPRVLLRSLVQNLLSPQKLRVGNVRAEQRDYAEIEALLESGVVRPHIEQTLPLERAAEAFAACERGGLPGKVVVKVR